MDNIESQLKSLRPRSLDEPTRSRLKGRKFESQRTATIEAYVRRLFHNPWIWSSALIVILLAVSHFGAPTNAPTAASRGPVITTLRNIESNRILASQTPLAILPGPSDTQVQLVRLQWIDYIHGRSEDGREFYWPEISSEIRPVILTSY